MALLQVVPNSLCIHIYTPCIGAIGGPTLSQLGGESTSWCTVGTRRAICDGTHTHAQPCVPHGVWLG